MPFLVAIGAAMIALGVLIYFWLKPKSQAVGLELIKALVQVAIVLVVGQIVATIVADRQHERETADREKELEREQAAALRSMRVELLMKLSKSYVAVKRSRRLLRARALTRAWSDPPADSTAIRRSEYDEYLGAINDAELELESLWHQLEAANAELNEQETLVKHVRTMKNYLREILHEYEQIRPQFGGADSTLPVSSFWQPTEKKATLADLLSANDSALFQERFAGPFHDVAYALRKALLARTGGKTA